MKAGSIEFARPIKVLQVFRNINIYGKPKKSLDDRKAELEWVEIHSKSGHAIDGQLFLPESVKTNPDVRSCDLITIEDDNQPQIFSSAHLAYTKVMAIIPRLPQPPPANHCLNLIGPTEIDIFELRLNDELELHLRYGYYDVGIPKRSDFKLCEIRRGKPVEVKINGKTDHSVSKGRDRLFKEQHYVFHYLGDFSSAALLREPFEPTPKHVPAERKVVDLIKQLW